jgi:threonine-phosphate decarboxylase
MALEAGLFCIPQRAFLEETPANTARLRKKLMKILQPHGHVVPSDANFVLLDAGNDGPGIVGRLYGRGILVRDASNFQGLGPGWLRFAVRPLHELKALEDALAETPAAGDA